MLLREEGEEAAVPRGRVLVLWGTLWTSHGMRPSLPSSMSQGSLPSLHSFGWVPSWRFCCLTPVSFLALVIPNTCVVPQFFPSILPSFLPFHSFFATTIVDTLASFPMLVPSLKLASFLLCASLFTLASFLKGAGRLLSFSCPSNSRPSYLHLPSFFTLASFLTLSPFLSFPS